MGPCFLRNRENQIEMTLKKTMDPEPGWYTIPGAGIERHVDEYCGNVPSIALSQMIGPQIMSDDHRDIRSDEIKESSGIQPCVERDVADDIDILTALYMIET
jgi:hypothetical protein